MIKTAVQEPESKEEIQSKMHNISCDEIFLFNEYINNHLNKLNASSNTNLAQKDLPIVEAQITRGKITHKFRALIDSGTDSTYVSPTLIKELGIRSTKHRPVPIRLGEGTIVTSSQSVSLKDLYLYRESSTAEDEMNQLHEPKIADEMPYANPFAELITDDTVSCNPRPYGPFQRNVPRKQKRALKAQRKRLNVPSGDEIIGVGPVDVSAIVLYGIESSGYDLIIGIRDIKRLKLTKIFESLFLDEEDVPLQEDDLAGSASPACVSTLPESKQVQNISHPKRVTWWDDIPPQINIRPGAINNISIADVARRKEWTTANTITVPSSALLDPLPPDDDYIDEYKENSPWEKYFSQS